jgi:hypothetical protein
MANGSSPKAILWPYHAPAAIVAIAPGISIVRGLLLLIPANPEALVEDKTNAVPALARMANPNSKAANFFIATSVTGTNATPVRAGLNGATTRLDSFDGQMRLFDFFTVAPFS